jgi:hypothetical protein
MSHLPRKRPVTRVLVMLEYGPEHHDSGEVFDLTALALEVAPKCPYGAFDINLRVESGRTYLPADQPQLKVEAGWSSHITGGDFAYSAHIEDCINVSMPDGERVKHFRTKAQRYRKKAEKADHDAGLAKLEQVAAIRHLHPVARVTAALPEIPAT